MAILAIIRTAFENANRSAFPKRARVSRSVRRSTSVAARWRIYPDFTSWHDNCIAWDEGDILA